MRDKLKQKSSEEEAERKNMLEGRRGIRKLMKKTVKGRESGLREGGKVVRKRMGTGK